MDSLQDLFEKIGYDEVMRISELSGKKSINPDSADKMAGYIFTAYHLETGIPLENISLSNEQLDEYWRNLYLSASLYINVLNGDMDIVEGKIKLTDGEFAKFSLTDKGIESVERKIKKI